MSSYEEFSKKKEQSGSYYEFARKYESVRQNQNQNSTTKNTTSIKNFTKDTGKILNNLLLGAKTGIEHSLNYGYKIGEIRGKTEQQLKDERVLGSNELTNTEKALYIAQQRSKNAEKKNLNSENNKNFVLPMLNNNTLSYDEEKVEDIANNNVLDRLINEDESKIQENIENQSSNFSKKLAELAPSIGNIGVGGIISGVNPAAGMAYFTTSAGGSYMQDALERGMTRNQAISYGSIMGLMEGVTESIGIENLSKAGKGLKTLVSGAGKTAVKEAFKGGTKEIAKNSVKTILKDYGIGIADNVMQEAIIEPIQEITAGAIGGKDKSNWNDMGQRMLKSGIDGGLTSAILGGANLGIQSCVGVIEKTRNGQNVTQQEFKTAIKDVSEQLDIEKMIKDSTQQHVNKYKTLTEQQQATQNEQNLITQQITPTENKFAQNEFSEQIANNNFVNKNNINQTRPNQLENNTQTPNAPMLNYQYEISDNKKINNLRRDANKYFNNTEKARNYVNMLEQIISDKDIDIRLDSNLKTADGRIANGSYSNGVITINPNSTKTGEFIAVHELTHAIGTDSMKSIIDTYRKSNIDFDNSMKSLLENYSTTELTDEALADVSAQLFGNQEFINNVSQSNPSVFKKIYNEIKYLWHQFRGYKNQDQFIDDLYYKWTQAYNSSNKLNETTDYSIAGVKGMKNAIKQDTSNLSLERAYNKAMHMAKNNIDNETIRQNTGWFQDRNGDWKFEFSDRDMSLKENIKLEKNKTYKLGDILEHDTLFEIYPELANCNVKFTDLNKPNGVYNIFDKDIKINNNQLNKKQYKNSIEGTLIHEIQHAIQDIENFEGGKSSKGSKLAYYESLGEIEASDIKTRFLQEKYNNIDLTDIAPESSKANPKHQKLNNYLNNRNLLDKAKDGVYNYIKKRNGGSYELSKENISKNKKQNMGLVDGRKRRGHVDDYEIENITNVGKNISENNREDSGVYRDRVNKKSQESENNSGSFSFDKNARRYEDLEIANTVKFNKKADGTINVEISDNNELINQFTVFSKESASKQLGNNIADYIYDNATENSKTINLKQTENVEVQDTSNKGKQLEIIKKTNPMLDDYHVGIRTVEDIKTFDEVINDKESFAWGDFSKEDAEKALKTGRITIYSSYPIEQGTFVSTSKIQAEEYAGGKNGKVYSKTVPIEEIAWINGDEGQYANINQKYSLDTDKWSSYLDTNIKSTGTKTNLEDIKGIAPIAQKTENTLKAPISPEKQIQMTQNNQNAPIRTSEQIANDSKISDLEAIKEESSKINTPTLQKANDTSNNISGNIPPDNTSPKSPTIDLVNKKRSKEKASLSQIKDTLAQKFINKGHYIDKLAKQTGNKNLTYLYDRTMNTFNEAQISIGDKQVITNASGNDIEVVGKSIIDIFSEADKSNLSNEFDDYLLNKHNISRYAYEKGVFGKEISATDSQNIVNSYEKQHPEFIKWSKEVSQYNDNNLKDLVNNGLVSKETYNKLRVMYEDYVPTFRDITENIAQFEDNFVGGNTLKKATQSDKSILSVKESMAEQTLAIKKAIRMNKLGVELYNTLGKNTKVNESVKGIEFDPVAIQTIAGDVISKAKDGTNTFMIFQDGVMTEFKISDELYSAFSKDTLQSKINNSDVAKTLLTPVEKLSKAQRELLTTYSIGFAFNNPIKDFQDALFNTKYSSSQFLKNYTKSLYNIAVDGSWYQNYKGNGGTANTYFNYETGILPNKNIKFGDAIKKANNILEQAPRLAEYISTIENGGSVDEALYNSADITTNFKRGGDITKVVNKYGANFLNASVQGLDKFYRNLTGQSGWKGYANLAVKATVWQVAPAILNGLLLGDDDDYEDLPEYTKDNYFLFKMNDGKFFRIPKGRVSSVVGGIARRALESSQGKDVDWNALIDTTVNQMAPNNPLSDNILAPIIQAKTNKAWYGGDIVSSRLQKLPNAEQFDESTDKLSKFLGEKLNISPKKINYVLDQYSGGIGDVVLPMLTPQAENNILEDKFTTDSVMKNKHVSEYYSLLDELEKSKNSINATNEDILKYKYLSDSSSDISELYQKKRAIQNSDLSDEEKKTQVREVQKQINDIVENKLENVDSVKVTNNTASIGSNKYYKYKDEWKVVSDKEANKIKGISLDIYADYQNKVAKLSEEKKKSDESVSQKDKIKILANSNWTTNEKDKIYTQIINDDDETYAVLKKLDSSKSIINQYLDYLQNDFKADREDDGTEKGKAVSGSKKKKVYNYINGIDSNNMSYTQKLYLTGVNTSLSSSDKKKIVDYINKSNSFSKQEKLEAIDKLQGVTVYKDGRISW